MIKAFYSDDYATIYHADSQELLPEMAAAGERYHLAYVDPPWPLPENSKVQCRGTEYAENLLIVVSSQLLTLADRLVIHVDDGVDPAFVGIASRQGWSHLRTSALILTAPRPVPNNTRALDLLHLFGEWEEGEDRRRTGGVYPLRRDLRGPAVDHHCAKPIAGVRWALGQFARGGPVLDPFSGSGTSLVAAKRMGIQATGIEIEGRHCELAAQRLRDVQPPIPSFAVPEPRNVQMSMVEA